MTNGNGKNVFAEVLDRLKRLDELELAEQQRLEDEMCERRVADRSCGRR